MNRISHPDQQFLALCVRQDGSEYVVGIWARTRHAACETAREMVEDRALGLASVSIVPNPFHGRAAVTFSPARSQMVAA